MDRIVTRRTAQPEKLAFAKRRSWVILLGAGLALSTLGCSSAQKPNRSTFAHTDLERRLDAAGREIDRLESESLADAQLKQKLERRLEAQRDVQDILERRVANLTDQNKRLQNEMTGVVMRSAGDPSVRPVSHSQAVPFEIPPEVENALNKFGKKYRDVTFDPKERVCRIPSRAAFHKEGDRLTNEAQASLGELVAILNLPAAKELTLLVVAHTATEQDAHGDVASQHPTDWHLAAHQAIAIQQYMEEVGMAPDRLGIVSYGSQQPLVDRESKKGDATNARVEVYIMPPDPPAEKRK
ncbi:flagellar motor protein MotD [Planctomycetes bacterium Pan216]|uniref:Flagellar motor protein MotD n=1 Tax=Kolteria novifilia TaxID=2527975 RepID=A0A518B956_9BACT|nr:flagellar motor protein MotD [Planctomycetes bacterium Pan216]